MIFLYAALLNNQLVLAVTEAQSQSKMLAKNNYICPQCKQRVKLIIKEKSAYFKHFPSNNNLSGEKEEHALSKAILKNALLEAKFNAQTETSLANGQLRADILVNSKLAFEIQCAPLSKLEFIKRHNLYKNIGVADIWIVGKRHYLLQEIKKSQLIFFRKNKLWHDYYLEILPKQKILRLKYNVQLEPITSKVHYQIENFVISSYGLAKLWHFKPVLKQYCVDPRTQKNYLQLQLTQKTIKGMKIANQLYQRNLTIDELPPTIFSNFRRVNSCNNVITFLHQM